MAFAKPESNLFMFSLRARSGVGTPDPISNSVVKHVSADDSWREASCESRSVRRVYFTYCACGRPHGEVGPACAGVAQLVEHHLAKVDVASSNLVSRSKHIHAPENGGTTRRKRHGSAVFL